MFYYVQYKAVIQNINDVSIIRFFFTIINCFFMISSVSELVNILVPGTGLGRLAFEIAKLGYSCQGNEYSLHMLFTSNFLLNQYVLLIVDFFTS